MTSGWRRLTWFWVAVLLVLGAGAGTLQVLGPPAPPGRTAASSHNPAASHTPASSHTRASSDSPARVAAEQQPKAAPLVREQRGIPPAERPGRDTPGPTADPDPSLLEPGPDGGALPRIAADGRMPMQVYAAGFDHSSRRPRVGLVVAGIGLDQAESTAAVHDLPRGVTFAVSPYAVEPEKILDAARFSEHEFLLSLPMEPESYPLNDPGPRALLTGLSKAENLKRLNWLLSRIKGYVGVTDALGNGMQGARFAAMSKQMTPVLQQIADRGLLFIDGRPDQKPLPLVWQRDADLVVDRPATGIEGKLAELERIARRKGSALGVALTPLPVTVQRIATWASALADHGLVLAPVSALVQPPPDSEKKTP